PGAPRTFGGLGAISGPPTLRLARFRGAPQVPRGARTFGGLGAISGPPALRAARFRGATRASRCAPNVWGSGGHLGAPSITDGREGLEDGARRGLNRQRDARVLQAAAVERETAVETEARARR